MPTVVNQNIKSEIIQSINFLTVEQQEQLIKEVNRMLRWNTIKDLENSVKPNNITMEEIVAETKAARKERDEKSARI